jgi:hypothetical protein
MKTLPIIELADRMADEGAFTPESERMTALEGRRMGTVRGRVGEEHNRPAVAAALRRRLDARAARQEPRRHHGRLTGVDQSQMRRMAKDWWCPYHLSLRA